MAVKSLPGDAAGVGDPGLVGLGVAAGGVGLVRDGVAGRCQTAANFVEFVIFVDLEAEVAEGAAAAAARGDCKVDSRIVEHPLGVVGLDHYRIVAE